MQEQHAQACVCVDMCVSCKFPTRKTKKCTLTRLHAPTKELWAHRQPHLFVPGCRNVCAVFYECARTFAVLCFFIVNDAHADVTQTHENTHTHHLCLSRKKNRLNLMGLWLTTRPPWQSNGHSHAPFSTKAAATPAWRGRNTRCVCVCV